MKQGNLMNMFKKKEEKPSSQQAVLSNSSSTQPQSQENIMQEEQKENHNHQPINIIEPESTKKKRLIPAYDDEDDIIAGGAPSTEPESENNPSRSGTPADKSLKKVKTEQVSKDEKVTIELKKDMPKKDLTNLKRVTDYDYNAFNDAPFWEGEDVPFSFLCEVYEEVSKIKGEHSKEKIIQIIQNMFRTIIYMKPDQLIMAYYFCIMKVAPDYEPQNMLGIGNEILVKAIAKASGRSEKQIRDNKNQIGDLGKVASESKASQSTMDKFFKGNNKKEVKIPLKRVMETFRKMAKTKGTNSANEKEAALVKLLFDAKQDEAKYLVRFVEGNLKIGAAEATMQMALNEAFLIYNYVDERKITKNRSWASYVPDYDKKIELFEKTIKQAICEYPDYDAVIRGLLKVGKDVELLLNECRITTGVPVKPMLAQPTKGINIVLKRFENMKFTCEYKYDGLRGQIHYNGGKCHLFSRNLENMTEQYPDVVEFVLESTTPEVQNFIIDSEIVAINPVTQRILPFQKLATRGRKNVDKNAIDIQVCLYVFDILYFNGKPLIDLPLTKRREYLRANFKEVDNKLRFAQHLDCDTFEEVEGFLNESIKVGCEGLMIKTLDMEAHYQPSKRSFNWLKLKKDYLDTGLGDSLDLVPIGALFGTGKRAGFYGSYLLACYNSEMERYETLCKTSTGLSDEQLETFFKKFSEHIIPRPLPEYCMHKDQEMDVWFEPCMVWEIKGADIQISPVYTAGIGLADEHKGVGLRFPRLMRVREDKKPTEATDATQIYQFYKSQAAVANDMEFFDADEIY